MEKMHLLCNAHLDPVWLWQRNEGIAEAISTFRVAADFCEEYDGFVFNHNEAILYEWVEEHEPQLFERIKKLVKKGNWKIMGGWYLQPDCVMTSGESLLSQIDIGNEYFMEKFGIKPTTAINFDPFGHTRGLVQILTKKGYDSYIFMRPYEIDGDFIWEGFDGSQVFAHGIFDGYGTNRGKTVEKIKDCIEAKNDNDVYLCLWGVGNHGGGPSRIDLEAISEYMKTSDVEIIHSSAEEYVSSKSREDLNVLKKSLGPCMVGCYTSMTRIKQANRRLENKIALTEKIMSYADLTTDFEFDSDRLRKAKKALAFCQFHDVLPGSGIKAVEDDSLQTFAYGEEIADTLYDKAFFKLCAGQKKANDGEIPIIVFNPHPYEIDGEFEIGFMLGDQNWVENTVTVAEVYDENGNPLPTQNEKPEPTFNLDWMQRIIFKGKLAPSSVTRFDCHLTVIESENIWTPACDADDVTVSNDRMTVRISSKTGLIDSYTVDGKEYIKNSGKIEIYRDNEDPWGMNVNSFEELAGTFELMSDAEANEFIGYPDEKIKNVRIIDDGCVRTKVQAFFKYNRSVAIVTYSIPKNNTCIDVDIMLYSNETNKMIKYSIDTGLCGTPYGETAFGFEELPDDYQESVFHKWCGIKESDKALYIINRGTYGGSFSKSNIKLSLLRTPVYSAHPIRQRKVSPTDKFLKHIDMGERQFSFRITTKQDIAREAQIYNEAPRVHSFFPSGDGVRPQSVIKTDNADVILSSMRKTDAGYQLTFYNASESANDAKVSVSGKDIDLHFEKHEIKIIKI